MSSKLESGAECAMGNGVLRFGSLNQVLNDDDLMRFMKGMIKHGGKGRRLGGFLKVARPIEHEWLDRAKLQ